MQILALRPYYFRAFLDGPELRLSDQLTIFYGGNGTGKSSLAEAIEWLLFGYTTRRRKGDSYSKLEYQGSYVNKWWPGNELPFVEAKIKLADDSVHTIRRTMLIPGTGRLDDTDSQLSVDGDEGDDLSSLGIRYIEANSPIVVQHGIQDLIHTRPIDRYRAISETLGLAELVSFKDVLDKAKNRYRNELPSEVVQARQVVRQSAATLRKLGLEAVAKRWQDENIDPEQDYDLILGKARELTGSTSHDLSTILGDVRERQTLEMAKIFDAAPYRPSPNLDKLLSELRAHVEQFAEAQNSFVQSAKELTTAAVARFSAAQIAFWKAGLDLIDDNNPEICPFCERPTLNQAIMDERRQRIDTDKELTTLRDSLREASDTCLGVLKKVEPAVQRLDIRRINDTSLHTLQKAFEQDVDHLEAFVKQNHRTSDALTAVIGAVSAAIPTFENAEKFVTDPFKVSTITQVITQLPSQLDNTFGRIQAALKEYASTYASFEPVLKRELSDEATVAQFTSLIEVLSNKESVELVALVKRFDDDIVECQRQADQYILEQQRAVLAIREEEMIKWYGRLSPNADVRFSGLIPGRNEFSMKADAFGEELNAAACLSQSQLNCLGLSIYIPNVVDPNSPFRFIMFDDPVQAMDDDHHESFLVSVMPALLDEHRLQVIVLTHLEPTANRLRNLNYSRNPLCYRFDKLRADGPQIKDYVPLRDELKAIRERSQMGEEERKWAVDRIRVLAEHVIRESYMKVNQTEVPPEYAKATARQLLGLFRGIPGVTENQCKGLEDTIEWSDPSHHTDPDWQIPSSANINPHIDRLYTIINQLGLQCD
jgi:DNA repair exonuclease SbcCD ATPase subunit